MNLGSFARIRVLIILTVTMYVVPFDYVGIGLATPKLRDALGFSPALLPWALGGYLLTFGGFLVLGGRLGDLYGRKRVLLVGLAIFGVCSVLTACVNSVELFLAARVAKGIGSALISPNALAFLNVLFREVEERNRSYGFSSFVGGMFSIAYLLCAGIALTASWRYLLFMNVPIVAVMAALIGIYLPESTRGNASVRFDIGGALLSVLAFGTLSFTVANAFRVGLGSPVTLGSFAVVLILFAVLWHTEARHPNPILPVRFFRVRNLVGIYIACFFWSASNTNYPISLFLQDALHYTPKQASLALMPTLLVGSILSLLVAKVLRIINARTLLIISLGLEVVGIGNYVLLTSQSTFLGHILPAALLTSIGFLTAWTAVRLLAITGIPDEDQGVASGAIFSMQQLG